MTDWLDELLLQFEADAVRLDALSAKEENRLGQFVLPTSPTPLARTCRDIVMATDSR